MVKLHRLGVRGPMLDWVDKYMRGRMCRATVDGAVAAEGKEWDLGIGQGGVLGPLFFLVYFSDLPIGVADGGKYADDAAVWRRLPRRDDLRTEAVESVQGTLSAIADWGKMWRLTFSPSKCQVVVLTPSRCREAMVTRPVQLTMGGHVLEQVMSGGARYLGVWVDCHLTFSDHIGKVAEKGWRRIQVLRSISQTRWGADRWCVLRMYEGWVRPVIEYGSMVYAGASQRVLSKLDKIQAAALRTMIGATATADIEAMHWDTGLPYLAVRRLRDGACTASVLRRGRASANAAAGDFQRWVADVGAVSEGRLTQSLRPQVAYDHPGGRVSPFEFLMGAYKLLGIWKWDPDLERGDPLAFGFGKAPWDVSGRVVPQVWPRLGCAGSRSKEQRLRAREYAEGKIDLALRRAARDDKLPIMAFTDGSADLGAGGGGAACVWTCLPGVEGVRVVTKEMGHLATNFSAETEALLLSLRGLYEAMDGVDPTECRAYIWSDCQPAIRLVSEGAVSRTGSYWSAAQRGGAMLKDLRQRGLEVVIDWIPAHCGVAGNERADKAAQAASAQCRVKGSVGFGVLRPHLLVKRAIVRSMDNMQLDWYRRSERARRPRALNGLLPPRDILRALVEAGLSREYESCLGRLRIGNETRPNARVRMGLCAGTECPHCGEADGTDHRLFDCVHYAVARARAKARLSAVCVSYVFDLRTLVGLWGVRLCDCAQVLQVGALYMETDTDLMESFLETRRTGAAAVEWAAGT